MSQSNMLFPFWR